MHADLNDAIIVRSVVDLGHNLGLQTVAEGVEDKGTWTQLAQLGCDDAQGYFLAKPMAPGELIPWMAAPGHPGATIVDVESSDSTPVDVRKVHSPTVPAETVNPAGTDATTRRATA
jgi:predicted signal transduction protein with EAL and GGDEF domain